MTVWTTCEDYESFKILCKIQRVSMNSMMVTAIEQMIDDFNESVRKAQPT